MHNDVLLLSSPLQPFDWRAYLVMGLLIIACPVMAEPKPVKVFDRVWEAAKSAIYPEVLVASHFTEAARQSLRVQAEQSATIDELRPIINGFLDSLGVSHTRFYSSSDLEYYFFRSLFSTRVIDAPKIGHLGYQDGDTAGLIREVLNGLPADHAGLRRGDRLLYPDGSPVNQVEACRRPAAIERAYPFQILRGEKRFEVAITCIFQNPNESLREAMENSVRRIEVGEKSVGYLRLWSGTHDTMLESYLSLIARLDDTDALILDLRGGFGGAWYDYLDPFYADRASYFEFTVLNREGHETFETGEGDHKSSYSKPLVVLINEGVRSGKEALAFQFRTSQRALVIGSQTAGYFSSGRGLFNEETQPYFLYLSTSELLLNGQTIEGVGVSPHITVDYPIEKASAYSEDPQLEAAQAALAWRLEFQDDSEN